MTRVPQPLETAPIPPEVINALERRRDLTDEELDAVHELHHVATIGPGRRVHVTEVFTLRSWMRSPRRGALLLPGTLVRGCWFDIDVDGYRMMTTLARRGFFVFAVDHEGTGQSTRPPNGYDVTHAVLVSAAREVVGAVRSSGRVELVDILGESNGGAVAAELATDSGAVRSCVMSSMLYLEGTEYYKTRFIEPSFVQFLSTQPDGYMSAGPELYFNITARMTPEVRAETLRTQPGVYAMGHVTSPFAGLPWFDPKGARVPGLVIQGTEDNIATQRDGELLAQAYGCEGGGRATLVRIPAAGHIPRVDPSPIADQWTRAVLRFLDPE